MKIREIMTKEVVSISPEENALQALEKLFKLGISGLPVVDKSGKLSGMFTEKEVIAKVLPSYIEAVGGFKYEENPKAVKQKVLGFSALTVKEVMRFEVITIDEDAALCEAAHLMLVQKARRLPVLNKDKKVTGIVSRGDVVKALFKEYKE